MIQVECNMCMSQCSQQRVYENIKNYSSNALSSAYESGTLATVLRPRITLILAALIVLVLDGYHSTVLLLQLHVSRQPIRVVTINKQQALYCCIPSTVAGYCLYIIVR